MPAKVATYFRFAEIGVYGLLMNPSPGLTDKSSAVFRTASPHFLPTFAATRS
jgi:hypothetical protein